MAWQFKSPTEIVNSNGFRLVLEEGSWWEPTVLSPIIPDGIDVRQAALLMREGLIFACRRNRRQRPSRSTYAAQDFEVLRSVNDKSA